MQIFLVKFLLERFFAGVHPRVSRQIFSEAKRFAAPLHLADEGLEVAVGPHMVPQVLAVGKTSITNRATMRRALVRNGKKFAHCHYIVSAVLYYYTFECTSLSCWLLAL